MGIINVLDKQLADLIAAGEVVGRASSVIKELLENSIDAGAKNIVVEIKGGGNIYMRVSDNGSGILKDDAQKAFLRHATSKIKKSEDLSSIATMGFRGEALAAICAVSKVDLITKTKDDDLGIALKLEGGTLISKQDAGCPQGTTIIIRDLFYNTPARLKFIKRDTTEAGHVFDIVQKLALSRPDIGFKLIKDLKEVLFTTGDGSLKNVIYSIYGKDFSENLIEVNYEHQGIKISGVVTSPNYYKKNKNYQNFFINKRYIKSPLLSVALAESFKGSLISERFPGSVLNLTLQYNSVDVNVDPSKLSVKFSDEKSVYDCLYFGVKGALRGASNAAVSQNHIKKPVIIETDNDQFVINVNHKNFVHINKNNQQENQLKQTSLVIEDIEDKETNEQLDQKSLFKQIENFDKSDKNQDINLINNYKSLDVVADEREESSTTSEKISLLKANEDILNQKKQESQEIKQEIKQETKSFEINRPKFLGEAFSTYILFQKDDELYIIDKHAAHEIIIYQQLKSRAKENTSQLLLTPVVLTVSPLEYSAFLENKNYFIDACFDIEDFGKNTVIIRQVPYDIEISEIEDLILQILNDFIENKNQVYDKMIDKLYMSIACKAAIKANNKQTSLELSVLVEKLFSSDLYKYCPHGRPTYVSMTKRGIEKQFGRI